LHASGDRLFSSGSVTIESLEVDIPHADRPHVAIYVAEKVLIRGFAVRGNQAAFAFDSPHGSPAIRGKALVDGVPADLQGVRILNGSVRFDLPPPVSGYAGFGSAHKVMRDSRALTDAEIDALGPPPR
jgi:hypothetical protein